jgi:hypothetical protein
MKQTTTALVLAAALAALPMSAGADATTSPGRETVHVSSEHGSLPLQVLTTLVSGTITKGKSRRFSWSTGC